MDTDTTGSESPALSSPGGSQRASPRPTEFRALYHSVNIDAFRKALIELTVVRQLSFATMTCTELRKVFLLLQPSLERYLVTSPQTIANWVYDEYKQVKIQVKAQLAEARSRIHISFDIWTAPNHTPIIGICAHFLTPTLELKHPLIGLKFIKGHHTGPGMADTMAAVIDDFEILPHQLGVYVADNAGNCTTTIRSLVEHYHPEESNNSRRGRCLGHIINLAAQAFIYGHKSEAFVNQAEHAAELSIRDQAAIAEEQRLWREKGAFGKFHNVVRYINSSYLREQRFQSIVKMLVDETATRGGGGFGAATEYEERQGE
jgi:hypothetical protein